MAGTQKARHGFTLIELLMVMTIIGILMSLALPGVTSVMETARKTKCANNLSQMGKACIDHATAHGHFPTGGWGWDWVGDPDRGFGRRQPGGWVYNILPYVDLATLHDRGKGETAAQKQQAAYDLIRSPLPFGNCPSRRRPMLFDVGGHQPKNCSTAPGMAAKGDYAICTGDQSQGPGKTQPNEWNGGPSSLADGDGGYKWPPALNDTSNGPAYSGISFMRSEIRPSEVRDGPQNTILLGEKYLEPDCYFELRAADNETMYSGFDNDNGRTTAAVPIQDQPGFYHTQYFGSIHAQSCNFVFCDGHSKAIAYAVDPTVFKWLGHRADDQAIDHTKY